MQIAENAEPRITFREIHELELADVRVLMFEIPAAPNGIPIAWKGHYYARAGESLTSLGLDKLDDIRRQTLALDWRAQLVAGATLDDLDEASVSRARESFAQKYANRFLSVEVEGWPLATFLDRARVTQNGQITRTALLLLGKAESSYRLSPYPAQLTWKLEGQERAYEHFSPPFLLGTTRLYQRIRNIQLRLLPQDELLPIEVSKYDQKIVLEALHNCLAHQDYSRNGRVVVTELPDRLVFENEGSFFEGQPDEYIQGDKTPRRYRNPALAQAMVELNMIDTTGYGIHSIYVGQARRYFPLPDFDLSVPGAVKLTIYGGVVDPAYSRLLIQNIELPLADVLALDRVQKKLPIPDEAASRLRRSKLIEGRKPNFHVSAAVAEATANKADYIRTRAQDDEFYAKLLTDYLEKFDQANRAEINKLLMDKLSDALDEKQKYNKISSLLTRLRRHGMIVNTGSDTAPCWRPTEKIAKRKQRAAKRFSEKVNKIKGLFSLRSFLSQSLAERLEIRHGSALPALARAFVLLAASAPVFAQPADPCETQRNTTEITQCLEKTLAEKDKLLNDAYQALLARLLEADESGSNDHAEAKRHLREAQRNWLRFRDADCKGRYALFQGGTIRSIAHLGCLVERTEQRTAELLRWDEG